LLIGLFALVVLIVVAAFGLTLFNLSAPRSTLKNLLGQRKVHSLRTLVTRTDTQAQPAQAFREAVGQGGSGGPLDERGAAALVKSLSNAARVNKRTTRTTLAITGFALLGVVTVAAFGLSGAGVRDLRVQVLTGLFTLVASIAGFYFGAQAVAPSNAGQSDAPPVAVPPVGVPPVDVPPVPVPVPPVPPADVPPVAVPPADVPPADVAPDVVAPADVMPADLPPADVALDVVAPADAQPAAGQEGAAAPADGQGEGEGEG
jgi:hypothetical protein